ncbi:MAG TPA: hypothetical protein VGO59_03215 [Verrucomicrobiae bacterium]
MELEETRRIHYNPLGALHGIEWILFGDMQTHNAKDIIGLCGAIVASGTFIILSLFSIRKRDRWAKYLLFSVGVVGLLCFGFQLSLDAHWILLARSENFEAKFIFAAIEGWLLGSLIALVISGQALGEESLAKRR